eukprot:jgi/Psemu1/324841/estExt_fgenesh1_pg.C_1810024
MEETDREDDAALVDSYFLPGGLFADESSNKNHGGRIITNNSYATRSDSLPTPATVSKSPVSTPLSRNPWETKNRNSTTIEAQVTDAANGLSVGTTPSYSQWLHLSHSPANNNDDGVDMVKRASNNYNGISVNNRSNLYVPSQNSVVDLNQNEIVSNRNNRCRQEINAKGDIKKQISDTEERLRPPPGFLNLPNSTPCHESTLIGHLGYRKGTAVVDNVSKQDARELLTKNHAATGNRYSWADSTGAREDHRWKAVGDSNADPFLMNTMYSTSTPTSNNPLAAHIQKSPPPSNKYTLSRTDARKPHPTSSLADHQHNYEQGGKNLNTAKDFMRNARPPLYSEHIADQDGDPHRSLQVLPAPITTKSNAVSLESNRYEGIGYDTDQAHVSRVVGIVENSTCSVTGNDTVPTNEQYSNPDPSSLYSEGNTRRAHLVSEKFLHHCPNETKSVSAWQSLLSFSRSIVECTAISCKSVISPAILAMQRSTFISVARQHRERVSRQMKQASEEFRNIINWLIEIEEVLTVLLVRLVNAVCTVFWEIIRVLLMLSSFLRQMLKFGLFEAIEEFEGVTTCYVVFYLLPATCICLMDYINLPHWTPHIVTWMAIYSLCYLVKTGTLHETPDALIPYIFGKINKSSSSPTATDSSNGVCNESLSTLTIIQRNLMPHRMKRVEIGNTPNENLCYIGLKILKILVPVLFVAEGFSADFGTIMGEKSTNRLINAYTMILVRKCLIKSPMGWISWATQVLMATYFGSSLFLDLLILLTGLSSIRFIRYLDAHRAQGKEGAKMNKFH